MSDESLLSDAESLASRAQAVLPAPFIQFASGGAARLAKGFDFVPFCYEFGERLVLIAGLTESGLYVHQLLADRKLVKQDSLIVDHLRKLIFERGYDRGLAITIVERLGSKRPKSLESLLPAEKPGLAFVKSRPVGTGQVYREQGLHPVQPELLQLIEYLSFLRQIEFAVGEAKIRFAGQPIELRPFVHWDGQQLELLVNLRAGDPPEVVYQSTAAERVSQRSLILDSELRLRLNRLAKILGGPADFLALKAEVSQEPLSRSLMPLVADTYPKINAFAQRVYDETDANTRYHLWCQPTSPSHHTKPDMSRANDEAFVTNQIIRECMEQDPVYVLERYFQREEVDPDEWLKWLLDHQESDVDRVWKEVYASIDTYRGRLEPFYPGRPAEVHTQVELFKARLLAQRVARLMDFQIYEQRSVDDISDYLRRVSAFRQYLDSGKASQAHLRDAVLAMCNSAEEILRFLCVFYEAVRVYDPKCPEGINNSGRRHIRDVQQDISRKGLMHLLGRFLEMGIRDYELLDRLLNRAGRYGIWPITSQKEKPEPIEVLYTLDRLRNGTTNRPGLVHNSGLVLSVEEVVEVVRDFLKFLEWMANAEATTGNVWRIYPALLALHVVSQNRCGVTSVRYVLKEVKSGSEQEVTLYTSQKLVSNAGFFYALANLQKVHASLWVDPILIPTGELDGPT